MTAHIHSRHIVTTMIHSRHVMTTVIHFGHIMITMVHPAYLHLVHHLMTAVLHLIHTSHCVVAFWHLAHLAQGQMAQVGVNGACRFAAMRGGMDDGFGTVGHITGGKDRIPLRVDLLAASLLNRRRLGRVRRNRGE